MRDINELKKEFYTNFKSNIKKIHRQGGNLKYSYNTLEASPDDLWEWFESKLNEVREDSVMDIVNKVESLIIKEIVLAQKEGSGTSRLTSFIVSLGDLKQSYLSSIGKDGE